MTVSSDQRKKTKAIPLSENFQSRALTKRLLHKTAMERTEIIRARKAIHHPSMKLSGTRAFECILKVKFVFCFFAKSLLGHGLTFSNAKNAYPFWERAPHLLAPFIYWKLPQSLSRALNRPRFVKD